jgi:hypothetical protein
MGLTVVDILEWNIAKNKLDKFKELEMRLRLEVCGELFIGKKPGKFTIKKNIEGLEVKAVATVNVSVDPKGLEAVWDNLTPLEKSCISHKPKLVPKQLKQLLIDDPKSKLFELITSKPGAPTLTIIEEE